MTFLEKLNFLMERDGLTQASLSQRSGIPYTTIANWYSRGYQGLKLTTVKKLAEFFGTTLDYFIRDNISDPDYGKTAGFELSFNEMNHIQKYRALDGHGKKMVDIVLSEETARLQEELAQQNAEAETIFYNITEYEDPMSAGTGQPAGYGYGKNLLLIKEPPRGTSYVAPIAGDSMEPTFHDGDKLFVQACYSIEIGEIGVFYMDGQQWVKELGRGVLISHNSAYEPRLMTEDIRCQGRVLGVCDASYFSE